ncbi:MAG: ROK family protein [Anaerolineae bacterium]
MNQPNPIYASVDLGGTKIACALAEADGRILRESTQPTISARGPEAVLQSIADQVRTLANALGRQPAALGIGVPGLADLERGTTLFLPNLPGHWRDIPVREILSPLVGCPVYLLNDVRMATLGELTYGHGRTAHTMAFLALGTGIGGGVAVDGVLRLGPLGAAGEIGHQTILPDGPLCGCGNHGCLETLASGPAITAEGIRLLLMGQAPALNALVRGDLNLVSPRALAAAAADDPAIRSALVRAAEYVGIGVANVITILHPDLVVLGGGVAEIGPLLFDTVRDTVKQRVRMFLVDGVRIEHSLLGEKAGMLGGIALAARQVIINETNQ